MTNQLYWNTVNQQLKAVLYQLMENPYFEPFRLVGGTSLSLQLGHRMSIDIDLFTDAEYGSVDFNAIDDYLESTFNYVFHHRLEILGTGKSYLIGKSAEETIKLDLYYTDPFFQPERSFSPIRLATIEEIIAMKVDIVQRGARKKDFWDLHELTNLYSINQMINFHKVKYPYHHDETLIRNNFTNFNSADEDFDPICLRGKHWELIKYDFHQIINTL